MSERPEKQEILTILEEMIDRYEDLPAAAKLSPINHYDFCSLLLIVAAFMRADCSDES